MLIYYSNTVALHVEGDRVIFENCRIYGNQDTMYLTGENTRHYFKNCTISGTTDFIFGSATALFESCKIISKKSSYISAASTPKGVSFGFVFKNCKLLGEGVENGTAYLGRPWRGNARTVFINCEMGEHIHPAGWKAWHSGDIFYAEYGSFGAGGDSSERVGWSRQLSREESTEYTPKKVFAGWLPVGIEK